MALDTVGDYIKECRVQLQDLIEDYRYPTEDLVSALNDAFLEIRRIRPDVVASFFREDFPNYSTSDITTKVRMDPMYRKALIYYILGTVQLRDDENNQDSRAAQFLNKFVAQLLTVQA